MQSARNLNVIRTLLSRKPRAGAVLAATFSTAGLFAVFGFSAGEPEALAAERTLVFARHQYWRLFTAIFAHRNLEHLVANALPWWGFSFLLFGYFGATAFPIGSLVLGTLVTALAILTYPAGNYLLGASGVVYLMGGFWLTMYLLIDRRLSVGRRLLHSLGFALALLAPQSTDPTTSYRTHAIGFFVGVAWGAIHFSRKRASIRSLETVEEEIPLTE